MSTTMIETTKGVNNNQFFNFEEAKVQALTLEQLERTHRENDVYEKPLRGIYHFALIHQLIDMCNEIGYNVELYDLFAANNKDRTQPGVVRLPQIEQIKGERAIEAHILRRVFANVRITDFDNQETTTNLAVAYHQKGIQIGFGPNVMICHNQCMLGAQYYGATYGDKGKGYMKFCHDDIISQAPLHDYHTLRKILSEMTFTPPLHLTSKNAYTTKQKGKV